MRPVNQIVGENDPFSIYCNATGNPLPSITWLKAGVQISFGNKLTVTKAQLKDNGTYSCLASNGIGIPSTASADVMVNGMYFDNWLPVHARLTFRGLLITYKAINGITPAYITFSMF